MITREQLLAEAKKVTTPVTVTHWYVTREQAEREMAQQEAEGLDPDRITSREGWHIELRAMEGGKLFSKRVHITPTSCVARVTAPEMLWREAKYIAERREVELRRDIAWYRLHTA